MIRGALLWIRQLLIQTSVACGNQPLQCSICHRGQFLCTLIAADSSPSSDKTAGLLIRPLPSAQQVNEQASFHTFSKYTERVSRQISAVNPGHWALGIMA